MASIFTGRCTGGLGVGLQRQEVFAVEVDHRFRGQRLACQHRGERGGIGRGGDDPIIDDAPIRRDDHGQVRVDVQARVQRCERRSQCDGGNFPAGGAGGQLGQEFIGAGWAIVKGGRRAVGQRLVGHMHILCGDEGGRERRGLRGLSLGGTAPEGGAVAEGKGKAAGAGERGN